MPDETKFSVNERKGEYYAEIAVRGIIRIKIKAESLEDARNKAEVEADRVSEDGFIQLDDINDVEVERVKPETLMYRVWDGKVKSQVSRLRDWHLPREPDERGF